LVQNCRKKEKGSTQQSGDFSGISAPSQKIEWPCAEDYEGVSEHEKCDWGGICIIEGYKDSHDDRVVASKIREHRLRVQEVLKKITIEEMSVSSGVKALTEIGQILANIAKI